MHLYSEIVIIKLRTLVLTLIFATPPYQRQIWDYKKADSAIIRKSLDSVNWAKLYDQKDINAQA